MDEARKWYTVLTDKLKDEKDYTETYLRIT